MSVEPLSRLDRSTQETASRGPSKGGNMRRVMVVTAAAILLSTGAGTALAANPAGSGQPSQTCLSSTAPNEPGNASSARGSAFNENGGIAGGVYAGSTGTHSLVSGNPKALSQYDVACYQVSH